LLWYSVICMIVRVLSILWITIFIIFFKFFMQQHIYRFEVNLIYPLVITDKFWNVILFGMVENKRTAQGLSLCSWFVSQTLLQCSFFSVLLLISIIFNNFFDHIWNHLFLIVLFGIFVWIIFADGWEVILFSRFIVFRATSLLYPRISLNLGLQTVQRLCILPLMTNWDGFDVFLSYIQSLPIRGLDVEQIYNWFPVITSIRF